MSIRKKNGVFYWELMVKGKRYNGTCEGCTTERDAIAYEKQIKSELKAEQEAAAPIEWHEKRKRELQAVNGVPFEKGFEKIETRKIKGTNRNIDEKTKQQFREFWEDMRDYMRGEFGYEFLNQITSKNASAYIEYISANGHYVKRTNKKVTLLSVSSINRCIMDIKAIFNALIKDDEINITVNPFGNIEKLSQVDAQTDREIFTEEEREKILHSDEKDKYGLIPLFRVAFYTGLRISDLCSLEWKHLDFQTKWINKIQYKTEKRVELPILDIEYMRELYEKRDVNSSYVFPQWHKMYFEDKNETGITYRINRYLNAIGIQTSTEANGKQVSTKGIHACRHTFATICANRGINIETVQNVLGHSSIAVTKIYQEHEKRQRAEADFQKHGFDLTAPKQYRHGVENLTKLAIAMKKFNSKSKKEIEQIAKKVLDYLDVEMAKDLFSVIGISYLPIVKVTDNGTENTDENEKETFLMENADL